MFLHGILFQCWRFNLKTIEFMDWYKQLKMKKEKLFNILPITYSTNVLKALIELLKSAYCGVKF